MRENILLEKSFAFAVRVVNAHRHLIDTRKEFTLSKLFLTSGTGIGSHAEDAIGADSRPGFLAELTLAYKDARRTKYWIRLLLATGYFDEHQATSLLEDVEELLRIIGSSQKTTKQSMPDS
jgi:four helix bundle protein